MMKLTGCNHLDVQDLRPIRAFLPPPIPSCRMQVEEPVYVHVRVRQQADTMAEARPVWPAEPAVRRLSVGSLLDCYI